MSELRITDTNSANDSKGRALGLEGNDFIYVLGGFVAALAAGIIAYAVFKLGLVGSLILALPLALLPACWVFFLRRGRPEGYAGDLLDQWSGGKAWTFTEATQPAHPVRDEKPIP